MTIKVDDIDSDWYQNEKLKEVADKVNGLVDGYANNDNYLVFPLDIPTPDGLPSVTHPSVLYKEGGWNGYRYWMSFTPYPSGGRENACLCASNDKVNWVVPSGLTNPIIPKPTGTYNTGSDTDIVFTPDNTKMIMIHRVYGLTGEQIVRTESTDGVNWVTPVPVLTTTVPSGTDLVCLSPTLSFDSSGQLVMYSVNKAAASASRLERRTSSDLGFTWSAPTTCSFPAFSGQFVSHDLWHADVVLVDGVYHMLANSDSSLSGQGPNSYRLFYFSSADGLNFTGVSNDPCVPLSGYSFDAGFGHYKSGWIPAQGSPLRWDVFVCGLSDDNPTLLTSTSWRLSYYPNMTLSNIVSSDRVDNIENVLQQRVWLSAAQFVSTMGSPTLGSAGGRYPAWLLDSATKEQVNSSLVTFNGWAQFNVDVYWANPSASTGDVRFTLSCSSTEAGGTVTSGDTNRTQTVTANGQNILTVTRLTTANPFSFSNGITHLRIQRVGDDAADTLNNDVAFIGMMLTRRS